MRFSKSASALELAFLWARGLVGPASCSISFLLALHVYAGGSALAQVEVEGPPPTATHFVVDAPGSVIQYFPFSITVTVQDQFNFTVTNYTGVVHFTSTDTGTNGTHLPPDSTLTNGTGTFTVFLGTPGSQTVTVSDASDPSITGTSFPIFVNRQGSSHADRDSDSSTDAHRDSYGFTDTNGDSGTFTSTIRWF